MSRTSKNMCFFLWLLVCWIAGCSGNSFDKLDKNMVKNLDQSDWEMDYCLDQGWYVDKTCDGFCPQPEADCDSDDTVYCGGFAGLICPEGYECIDIPDDGCDTTQGGADCMGICVKPAGKLVECIVSSENSCPAGQSCVDISDTDCDPKTGTDCPGLCTPNPEIAYCGGFAGFVCNDPLVCEDIPDDNCDMKTDPDCLGICVEPETKAIYCDGIVGDLCPEGMDCEDIADDGCDPKQGGVDCLGICVASPEISYCAGIAGLDCLEGLVCVDDPDDSCDLNNDPDCSGICVPQEAKQIFCGGFAGSRCPEDLVCADFPDDDCMPEQGDADCLGVCTVPDLK